MPAPGPSSQPAGRLDESSLAPSVQRYFQGGLASSTQATYSAALRRFHSFCTQYNIFTPLPFTKQLLCCFSAFIADQGLAPQTGKSYLAAIRSMQIPRDHSSMPILKRVQAGIRRARMQQGVRPRIRLPITVDVLARVQRHLTTSSHPHHRVLWAISTTDFSGSESYSQTQQHSTPQPSLRGVM